MTSCEDVADAVDAVDDDDVEYRYRCTLTPELIEKAERELNETERRRDEDVRALREAVLANENLTCPLDSAFLLRFLRARKFDQERAYRLLLNYYSMRARNSYVLRELTPSATEHILDYGIACVLPVLDRLGRKIFYFRPGKWKPSELSMVEILRVNLINLEEVVKDEDTQVNGAVAITNFSGLGMIHVRNLSRTCMRLNSSMVQDAFPMRFKGMHFINEPTILGYLFAITKPFLKAKTLQRLTFHGSSLESLQREFNKECLPQELGGDLPSGDKLAEDWKCKLMENEQMFQDMKQYKIKVPDNEMKSRVSEK